MMLEVWSLSKDPDLLEDRPVNAVRSLKVG